MRKMKFKIWLLAVVMLLGAGSGNVWGQTTVNYAMSSMGLANAAVVGTSIRNTTDDKITFTFAQNSSGTAPVYYTSGTAVRLYQNATKGGSIKILVASGYKITSATVTKASGDGDGPVGYAVDGGSEAGSFTDGTTSNTTGTINATSSVEFYSKGSSATTRFYVVSFSVTYEASVSAPTTQAYGVNFTSVNQTGMTINWTNGNGTSRAVFVKETSGAITNPVDGTTYTASTNWSSKGTQLGTSGFYCVYDGPGTSAILTNLASNTAYYVQVFEYNGIGANSKFYTATATNNPNNQATTAATSPVITASGTINAFANTVINATSSEQSYTVQGSNLTDNVIITPPAGFQISKSSGSGFVSNPSTLSFTPVEVTEAQNVYVRFAPTAAQTYSGNITHTSTDATPVNIALSGTGVKAEPSNHASAFTATTNSSSQITVTWADATGAQVPDGYLVKASTSTPTAPADGTAESDATLIKNIVQGTEEAVFTGLSASTAYNFSIWPYTNSGTVIDYKTGSEPTSEATTETPLGVTVATAASDITADSFTANWGVTASATGYDVSVYTKSTGIASTATEIFNNPTSANPPVAPTGWIYTLNTNNGNAYIKMISSSDVVISETVDLTNYATAKLNANLGSFGTISSNSNKFTISVSTNNGASWIVVATPLGTNGSGIYSNGNAMDELDLDDYVGNSQVKIKFETLSATGSTGGRLSKIVLTGKLISTTTTPLLGSPFTVSGATSKVLSSLNPGTEYFYTVVAKRGDETSAASNEESAITDFTFATAVNASTLAVCPTCDVIVASGGHLTIDENRTYSSITVNPTAKLTVDADKTLTVTGNLTIESGASGTASLVNNGTLAVSGTNTMQQYLTTGRNWYISSPITAAQSSIFTSNVSNKLWERDVENNEWDQITAADVTLSPLKGYVANVASTGTVSFTGALNSGALTPLTLTAYPGTKGRFHLVGNPYPSYLDWQDVVTANTNLTSSMWFRTKTAITEQAPTSLYTFSTVQYTIEAGLHTVNGNANTNITKKIPPMQAYWVRIKDGVGSVDYTLNNNMRSHTDDSGNKFKAPAAINQTIRLVVSNGSNSDEALLYFNSFASNEYDRFDSPKMFNDNTSVPEIYTTAGNEQLVINGMNNYYPGMQLALGFKTLQSNNFSIRASQIQNFDADTKIMLKDNLLGNEFDLTAGGSYNFSSDVVSGTDRFSVLFKSASGTTDVSDIANSGMFVYSNDGRILLNCNNVISENASVTVFNGLGQLVHKQQLSNLTTTLNRNFENGVYVLKVENGGKTVVLRTLVK